MIKMTKYSPVLVALLALHCTGNLTSERGKDASPELRAPDDDASIDGPTIDGSTIVDATSSQCEDRETHFKGNCYLATGIGSMDYQMAKDVCTSMKSKPVSIHSAEENKLIFGLLFHMTSSAWIGLTRDSYGYGGAGFVWEDGKTPSYANWAPGEPDSSECAVMRGPLADQGVHGQWADRSCSSKYREIVCKRAARP